MNAFSIRVWALLWLCSACTMQVYPSTPPVHDKSSVSIYVVNHGWHTGLIVKRTDIPLERIPELADFPSADYLELGWGDWDYYQSTHPGIWLTLKAALWPTSSVLHIITINGSPEERFAGNDIMRLAVTHENFAGLITFLHHSFLRNGAQPVKPIASAWGSGHFFYPASGKFHLFNTCNSWTARALESAGYPPGLFEPVTAEQLMTHIKTFSALK